MYRRDELDALGIDASGVSRERSIRARVRVERARYRNDQIVHSAREIIHADLGALAEGLGDPAVPLGRDFRAEIRVSEARKIQLVKARRAKAFAVAAAQRDPILQGHRHRPCLAHFLAELAVAVDAKSSGRNQVAVKEAPLLFDITRILLSPRIEDRQAAKVLPHRATSG